VKLDPDAVKLDSDAEAGRVQATGYGRPEDVETGTSTGNDRRGDRMLYVAVTTEARVLAIDLNPNGAGPEHQGQVFVSDYVKAGVNAPADFSFPDNLSLDESGDLFITEDPGGNASEGKTLGDDVWFAPFNPGSSGHSKPAVRFLSITDCEAEPTGVYVSPSGRTLFLNIQHRGGDGQDLTLGIQRLSDVQFRTTTTASKP
jgi:secreted PhoX family phosphatase